MNNGYVYVASLSSAFYKAAVLSAISLRDYYPQANITLYTHEEFVKDEDKRFFNNIVTGIPYNKRAKIWGIARTPYDNTLYLDADTEIRSERIKDVFDILGNNDVMFTKIVPHVAADRFIDKDNNLDYHGGIILYNNKPHTIELMNEWYDLYQYQQQCDWPTSKFSTYSSKMRPWDQFTMWYLLFKDPKYATIKHKMFPNGGHEYNYIHLLDQNKPQNVWFQKLDQVIYHYTIPGDRVRAGHIKN